MNRLHLRPWVVGGVYLSLLSTVVLWPVRPLGGSPALGSVPPAGAPLPTTPQPPVLPMTVYGTLTLNGGLAANGTTVLALISGTSVATATVSSGGIYQFTIPGDDPNTPGVQGGIAGNVISFAVSGYLVQQTTTWTSGAIVNLNLTGDSASLTATASAATVTSAYATLVAGTATASAATATSVAGTATAVNATSVAATATAVAGSGHKLFLPLIRR